MEKSDFGKEKVQEICDQIQKETLEPAKKEAAGMIENAKKQAEQIILDAKKNVEKLEQAAKKKIDEERNVFEASMNLSAKKTLSSLKEKVEKELFNPNLAELVKEKSSTPDAISAFINAIVNAIEKEGLDGNLLASIPKTVSKEAVMQSLQEKVVQSLQKEEVVLAGMQGGATVKIMDKNIILDLSDEALKTMLADFVSDDFKSMIFAL